MLKKKTFLALIVPFFALAACGKAEPPEESGAGEEVGGGEPDSSTGGQTSAPVAEDDNRYSDPHADLSPRHAPDLGPHVLVFRPDMSMSSIQGQIDEVFAAQEEDQMGEGRYAFLLHPGQYELDVNVGYYTDVQGLGEHPDAVEITGAVRSEADWFGGNSTHNFWRSASNMKVVPTVDAGFNRWAVSQAAPFRRMHIAGDMVLDDGGWSSGGFLADSVIEGDVNSGSQQQWFTRNAELGGWKGSVWNMFFLGVTNAPQLYWPPFTVVPATPLLREKPFLFVNAVGNYYVHVPELRTETHGVSWADGATPGRSISIEEFYVARPDIDDAASMNEQLEAGKNLLLTPGVYRLDDTITVPHAGTVVLGLGLPSLLSLAGQPVLEVADVPGVKVAGITIDAGPEGFATLMRVGPEGSNADHSENPTSLHDIFCRVGGGFSGSASACLEINSNQVIGDHFWLWRADHGNGVGWEVNRSKNGLIVNGDEVTIYGLFVEHFHEYQTLWNGEAGRVFFYQCEMPYDPPSQEAWQHDGVNGYPGYKVGDDVQQHEATGLGVYAVFHDAPVKSASAIEVPERPMVKLRHMVTRSLGGSGGEITSVINGQGEPANDATQGADLVEYPPSNQGN